MLHIKDEGSHFDVPIRTLWKYLEDDTVHALAHRSVRNLQVEPLTENAFLGSHEQNVAGTWVKARSRQTLLPPLGIAVECLEGPLAGSKFVFLYTPKGDRTEVTMVGDFTSPTIPPPRLGATVRELFSVAFDEDAAALRAGPPRG
jgi:hypothetical protein